MKLENIDEQYLTLYNGYYTNISNSYSLEIGLNPEWDENKIKQEFRRKLSQQRLDFTEKLVKQQDQFGKAHTLRIKNDFIEELIILFSKREFDYKSRPVYNFFKTDLKRLKEKHINRFEYHKQQHDYEFNTKFMYKASYKQIINLLAEYYANLDFERNLFPAASSNSLDVVTKKSKSNEYTPARQALAMYFILDQFGVTYEDMQKRDFTDFLHMLAARELPNTGVSNSYFHDQVKNLFNKTFKKSIGDLKFILPRFQKLQTYDSPGIDNIINKIQGEIDEYYILINKKLK